MSDDEYSVFDRLWGMVSDRFEFLVPLWVVRRPETLMIFDYRPTVTMFLTALGLAILAVSFVLYFFKVSDWYGLLGIGVPLIVCIFFVFRGTIREVYYFDRTNDSYSLVRQFIHRREVLEGSLSQFTGAYVKTERYDQSESHFVVLKQEGMFLSGVGEQTLREEVPLFNSFEREARIANAISTIVNAKR